MMMAQHQSAPAAQSSTITPATIVIALGTLGVCAFMVFMIVYVTMNTPGIPWKMFR
jgi:hypothetical protein